MDEALYSRQLYTIGHEAMASIQETNILISGLGGLGIEVAKCVILGGVKSIVLHDNKNISILDLSTNYYITEEDINKPRIIAIDKLNSLNPYVKLETNINNLEEIIIENQKTQNKFNIIVLTDNSINEQININKLARQYNIKFISSTQYGGFGNIFCDFGNAFVIKDKHEEIEFQKNIMTKIECHQDIALIETELPHNLSDNSLINFIGHASNYFIKEVLEHNKFTIYSSEINKIEDMIGSEFIEVKQPIQISFNDLETSIKNPEFIFTEDITLSKLLHELHLLINNNCPNLWSKEEADIIYNQLLGLCPVISEINKNILYKLIYTAQVNICALSGILGSICAQEIMKACSGKFTPIRQWLYYDISSCLPDTIPLNISDKYKDTRYNNQALIFGQDFQDKLIKEHIFIVGAGAIGSEHLKNFAMMGIQNITITDMDRIERSNLNRQFLFRNQDINLFKSEIAKREIQKINKHINIVAHTNKIDKDTEHIYNKDFYNNITCIANALDNIEARLYTDQQCILYKKPLLEAGTLGTKGNTQIIIPYKTETYGSNSIQEPPEPSVPVCTIKSFPYMIEHCITFAQEVFYEYFVQTPNNMNKNLDDKNILEFMPDKIENAVSFAHKLYNTLFIDSIKETLDKFPVNHQIDGRNFWIGTKKCPNTIDTFNNPEKVHYTSQFISSFTDLWTNIYNNNIYKSIIFDKDNDTHINFITSLSNLRAINYNIKCENSFMIKKIAGRIMPALATTTSLISSLTTIELYKLLQNKDITQYKNSYVNLALSYFGYTEPVPAPIIETENNKFTLWDLERLPDMPLKEVMLYYERKYNIQIEEILIGSARIYSNIIKSKKQKERLDQNISIINKEFNQDGQIILYISGNDIEYPPCMIML